MKMMNALVVEAGCMGMGLVEVQRSSSRWTAVPVPVGNW